MKLSTRSRYGLRAMYELAHNYKQGPVSIKTISENQEISTKYLHSLLSILKSGGLVRSIWGSHGGFVLADTPSKIKIIDIVSTLEGSISVVDCVSDKDICGKEKDCITRKIWVDVNRAIEKTLSGITLNDLIKKEKKTTSKKKK